VKDVGILLNEDLIILDADVNSAEGCILMMGSLFERYGYVKEGYSSAVIKREVEYPTGLPGKIINIAIPHTNSELVNKATVGVIIPKEPVVFRMMGMKDKEVGCELIMPLVVKDPKHQLDMLKKIMKIIQNGELLKKVRDSKSKKEVIDFLSILEPIS
jgi:PTS system galactitol-specific IIA component